MTESLRALLAGIVDYAGLFPPAKLPLDQAIRNYAAYGKCADAWMLGRFICPAARLAELEPFVPELFPAGCPLTISALGRGGNSSTAFLAGLPSDLQAIQAFRKQHGERTVVDVFEVRLPPDVMDAFDYGGLIQFLQFTQAQLAHCAGIQTYFELSFGADWRRRNEVVASALTNFGYDASGIKIRCGGIDPSAFPTAEQIAHVLLVASENESRLKATAGLHHPFHRYDDQLGLWTHGFMIVFVAGVLGWLYYLDESHLVQLLGEEDAGNFGFDDVGLRWTDSSGKAHSATTEQIRSARENFVTSFGSCSFDEPREHLRALGLL